MNHSLDLAMQMFDDRRERHTERHPKAAWNRHERRTVRTAARRSDLALLDTRW